MDGWMNEWTEGRGKRERKKERDGGKEKQRRGGMVGNGIGTHPDKAGNLHKRLFESAYIDLCSLQFPLDDARGGL